MNNPAHIVDWAKCAVRVQAYTVDEARHADGFTIYIVRIIQLSAQDLGGYEPFHDDDGISNMSRAGTPLAKIQSFHGFGSNGAELIMAWKRFTREQTAEAVTWAAEQLAIERPKADAWRAEKIEETKRRCEQKEARASLHKAIRAL